MLDASGCRRVSDVSEEERDHGRRNVVDKVTLWVPSLSQIDIWDFNEITILVETSQ